MASRRNGLLALFAAMFVVGCPDEAMRAPEPWRSAPAPIVPGPPPAKSDTPPAWVGQLPEAEARVRAGERVWASQPVPGSEMVDVAIYTVEGVHDGTVSLTDRSGQRVDGIHPALVHPAPSPAKLADGDVVLFYTPTAPAVFGRIVKLVGGEAIKVRYDRAGQSAETEAEHVTHPATGIAPMAYVGFPKAGTLSRGLVIAATDALVFVRTASGHVEVHRRSVVESLPLPPPDVMVGAPVRAYQWATGFESGVVASVLEPGLRYLVRFEDERERSYFFSAVLPVK
jgi:hypothetical protein